MKPRWLLSGFSVPREFELWLSHTLVASPELHYGFGSSYWFKSRNMREFRWFKDVNYYLESGNNTTINSTKVILCAFANSMKNVVLNSKWQKEFLKHISSEICLLLFMWHAMLYRKSKQINIAEWLIANSDRLISFFSQLAIKMKDLFRFF